MALRTGRTIVSANVHCVCVCVLVHWKLYSTCHEPEIFRFQNDSHWYAKRTLYCKEWKVLRGQMYSMQKIKENCTANLHFWCKEGNIDDVIQLVGFLGSL